MSVNFYKFSKILEEMAPPPPPPPPPRRNELSSHPKYEEARGLWTSNSKLVRLGYLGKNYPDAERLSLLKWEELPVDAQKTAMKDMFSRSPFKEQ